MCTSKSFYSYRSLIPEGLKEISSAIIFGGRRPEGVPLVYEKRILDPGNIF